ncbi:PREDICTED: uncharacterized protein LOC109485763 [Branchiostoma belcheri]|uniref:Uncharacterized protein LOC109485763 n=1 Tax=Branchiostoma belcheri TaxID=7741 RepID=A0A6P5AF98_BRABE|nr:PREDICTED: uncharacterized protein LOC109485763 [Branchiostoma belcheri]XP_019645004.1 PREDICTED: uncharacterized protein LOC109485763 [Branchiostoma belcheri]
MTPFLLLFVALATASPVKRQTSGLDADGDGLVSQDELMNAMTLQQALTALDSDGDGFIYLPQIIELWGVGDKFYELNTDGDNHLNFTEIENGMTLMDFYNQFDFNGDGTLDQAEAYQLHYIYDVINMVTPVEVLDDNGDGLLSNLEVQSHMTYNEILTALDVDESHRLDFAELSVLLGSQTQDFINAQDDNNDGVVSFGEAHHHHANLDTLFDRLDLDNSGYIEDAESAGINAVWAAVQALPVDPADVNNV